MSRTPGLRAGMALAKMLLALQEAALRLVDLLLFGWRRARTPGDPARILVFRVAALGDFILTVPALSALRKKFPGARILLVSLSTSERAQRARVAGYSGGGSLPWLQLVTPALVDETLVLGSLNPVELYRDIRPRVLAFDAQAVFLLSDVSAPAGGIVKKLLLLAWLGLRAPVYGLHMRANHLFLRKAQHDAGLFRHHVYGPLQAVMNCPLGREVRENDIEFPLMIAETNQRWASDLWSQRAWSGRRVIALVPGSLQPHKRWPLEQFIVLAQALLHHADVELVILGTAEDRALAVALSDKLGARVFSLAGATSVGQLAAVLARCTLVVGNDGGTMHLASALGSPTVSIMPGIQYPGSIEPWADRHRAVRHPVPCAPCYSFAHCPLAHANCMTLLPLQSVLDQCLQVLDGAAGGDPVQAGRPIR